MLKHVIVERPLPGQSARMQELASELWHLMSDRGWRLYRAWRIAPGEEGEPALFDLGMLTRATTPGEDVWVFEGDFEDRAALDAQLAAMRNDAAVVRITIMAGEHVDRTASRAFILEPLHALPRVVAGPATKR